MSNSTFDGRDAVPFGQLRDDDEPLDEDLDDASQDRQRDATPLGLLSDDDEPLDEDLDDEAVDSADADERAAREGTKGDDDSRV
jgi:hypothetical protein